MATVNCPDCGKEVSPSAKTCPHCGKPNKAVGATPTKPAGCFLQGIGAMVLFYGISLLSRSRSVGTGIFLILVGGGLLYWGGRGFRRTWKP